MKLKLRKSLAIICIGTITAGAMTMNAATLSKTVKAVYNNIRVRVDGQYKTPKLEPFFIGDSVYVSLRDAGELTNNQINWDSINQTVDIQTAGSQVSVSEIELAEKNAEIARLKSEVEKLKEKVESLEGTTSKPGHSSDSSQDSTSTSASVKEVYNYIVKNYAKKYNIDWTFELSEKSNGDLKLKVMYDSYYDGKDFDSMSDAAVKNLMKDIIESLQDQYKDVAIEGTLYDSYKKETVAEFSLTSSSRYSYELVRKVGFTRSDLDQYESILESKYSEFPYIDFGADYDGKSIRMKDIKLTATSNTIEFGIHTTFMDMFSYAWNNVKEGRATDKLETYMDDIQEAIEDKFDVRSVTGYLYNAEGKLMAEYRDGDLKLKNLR